MTTRIKSLDMTLCGIKLRLAAKVAARCLLMFLQHNPYLFPLFSGRAHSPAPSLSFLAPRRPSQNRFGLKGTPGCFARRQAPSTFPYFRFIFPSEGEIEAGGTECISFGTARIRQ
jgi:hypothetical protein